MQVHSVFQLSQSAASLVTPVAMAPFVPLRYLQSGYVIFLRCLCLLRNAYNAHAEVKYHKTPRTLVTVIKTR